MELSKREEGLVEALRRLPPAAAEELTALAERLASLPATTRLDWSDAWSDPDLREFTAESVRRLEEEERDPSS
jgi:hypothetical protein